MNLVKTQQALFRAATKSDAPDDRKDIEVVIQLPDNEPPVGFTVEYFGDTVVLFPKPHIEGHVWDIDTNRITSHDPKREAVEAAVASGDVEAVMSIVVEARRGRA